MNLVHERRTVKPTVIIAALAFLVAVFGILVTRSIGAGDGDCFKKIEDQWCVASEPCACAPAGLNVPDYISAFNRDIELPGWDYVHDPNALVAASPCYNQGPCQLNTDADPCYIDPVDETIYYPSTAGAPARRIHERDPNVGGPCPVGPIT